MHSKYDNMHKNGMFYALLCINNYVITSMNCMLSKYKMYDTSYIFLYIYMMCSQNMTSIVHKCKDKQSYCVCVFSKKPKTTDYGHDIQIYP